jgi:hypothetical protein
MDNYKRDNLIRSVLNKVGFIAMFIVMLLIFFDSVTPLRIYILLLGMVTYGFSSKCMRCGQDASAAKNILIFFSSWDIPCTGCEEGLENRPKSKLQEQLISFWRKYGKIAGVFPVIFLGIFMGLNHFFPNIYWFYKLWTGGALSAFVCFCIFFTFAEGRNLFKKYGLKCSAVGVIFFFNFIVAATAFSGFYQLEKELKVIRSLSSEKVQAIFLNDRQLNSEEESSFLKACSNAMTFYPNHEGSGKDFKVLVTLKNNKTISFTACVYLRHQSDIVFKVTTSFAQEDILIPEVAPLLERKK